MNKSKTYFAYLEASAGISGDMMLGALLDLGVEPSLFKEKIAALKLPLEIKIKETKRASIRGLKVDIEVKRKKQIRRKWSDIESFIQASPFSFSVKKNSLAIFMCSFILFVQIIYHTLVTKLTIFIKMTAVMAIIYLYPFFIFLTKHDCLFFIIFFFFFFC